MVAELEALGADITRAHYALSERMLDRLDAAGILVWSQAPIYHRDALLTTAAQRAEALRTVRKTVLATRNHPRSSPTPSATSSPPAPTGTPEPAASRRGRGR